MKWHIYKITVNKKSYIGLTIQPKIRKNQHINDAKRKRTNALLHEELRKSSYTFNFEIIHHDIDLVEDAMDLERKYIKQYNTKHPNGLNMTDGGEGTPGWFIGDEVKSKISSTLKKYFEDENNRKKNSDAVKKALAEMPEDKKRLMISRREMSYLDPDRNAKLSKSLKLYYTEDKKKEAAIKRGSRPFDVYRLDGTFIGRWVNKTKCAEELGLNRANMRKVLNGKSKHIKGYILRYL